MLPERLQGLLLILAGCLCLTLIYLAQQNGWLQQARPPTPPGVHPELLPVITPLSCVLPMAAMGALGLCFAGAKKLVAPDDWQAPKHIQPVSPEAADAGVPRRVGHRSYLKRVIRRLIGRRGV
jgi:hypothetical protein